MVSKLEQNRERLLGAWHCLKRHGPWASTHLLMIFFRFHSYRATIKSLSPLREDEIASKSKEGRGRYRRSVTDASCTLVRYLQKCVYRIS